MRQLVHIVRPFKIDSFFLVNLELKNLLAGQEKKWALEKSNKPYIKKFLTSLSHTRDFAIP